MFYAYLLEELQKTLHTPIFLQPPNNMFLMCISLVKARKEKKFKVKEEGPTLQTFKSFLFLFFSRNWYEWFYMQAGPKYVEPNLSRICI